MYIAKIPEDKINILCFYTYYHSVKEKGTFFRGQRHMFWEINILLDGEMTLTCDDKIINLSKNQMYLIHPNEFHKYTVSGGRNIELFVLTFSMELETPKVVYNLTQSDLSLVKMICDEIDTNFPDKSFNNQLNVPQSVKNLTELLLIRAITYDAAPYVKNNNSDVYERAVKFMLANIFDKITIHDIAQHCMISDSSLKLLFNKHTKGGVIHYFMELKLEYSKKLLKNGYTINSIAEELKFSSAAHFSSAFKKQYGISPIVYKKL